MTDFLHSVLYSDYSPEKEKKQYKVKTLLPRFRAWHKIILGCINPRPTSNSADYINMNQKYMLYCLEKKKKISLPFVIFHYLKEIISKSRTTGRREGKKPPMYIPFGRLISDILVESGLVADLIAAQCTEDLTETTGEVLDARNMKKIGAITDVKVDPEPEDLNEAIRRRIFVDGFPNFTKHDNVEVLALYLFSLEQEGLDTSQWTYDDFPDCPPDMLAQNKRKSRKRKLEEKEASKQKKKSKKAKKEKAIGLGTHSAPSKGTSSKPSSDSLNSEHVDTIMSSETPTSSKTPNPKSTQVQTPPSTHHTQTTTSPTHSSHSHQSASDIPDPTTPPTETLPTHNQPPPTSETLTSDIPYTPPHTSDTTTSEPPLTTSDPIIELASPTYTYPENPSSEIILFDPKPNNIMESIDIFGLNAKRKASAMMKSPSFCPNSIKMEWEEYQRWMFNAFKHMYQASEIEKLESISAAYDRREQWLQEEALRSAERDALRAEKQKVVEARETLLMKATQEVMQAEAEEKLRAETARSIFMQIQKELMEDLKAREEAKSE